MFDDQHQHPVEPEPAQDENSRGLSISPSEESLIITSFLSNSKLCLACGSLVVSDIKIEQSDCEFPPLPENEVFSSFCELLKIRLSGRIVWWDFNPTSSSSRIFCVDCMRELSLLQDLKRRLEELKKDLENGVAIFKEKCCVAEAKFDESDIYDRDKRYDKIRRQITGIHRSKWRKNEKVPNATTPRRSSMRNRAALDPVPQLSPALPSLPETPDPDHQFPSNVKDERISEDDHDHVDAFLHSPVDIPSDNDVERDDNDPAMTSKTPEKLATFPEEETTVKKNLITKKSDPKPKRKIKTKNNRNGKKPKAQKKKEAVKKPRKWEIISDDGLDFSEEEEEESKSTKKKRRRKADKDFEPETDYDPEDDDELDDRDIRSERVRFDAKSGKYYFLNVAYEKLDNGKFKCLECKDKEIIIFKYTIRKHSIRAHTNAYSCKECGHCEGSNGDLQKHIRDFHHQGGKRFIDCPICGKPCSSNKGRLQRHMTTHYSEQEKQDAIARGEKVLTWADVHSKRDYQCDNCGKAFESKWYLKQHILAKHPDPTKEDEETKNQRELCPKCGKLFLKYYIKVHQVRCQDTKGPESNRKFICSLCDKRFYRNVELRRHKMSVHEKNYPFQCTHCPKGFSCERLLRTHMNRHMGVRPFPCDHCPSAFFTKGNLVRHIGIYHEDGSNPKRKTYSKKDPPPPPTNDMNLSKGDVKVEKKGDETQPKIQEDLMRTGHFLLPGISPTASGSQAQDLGNNAVLFSSFPNQNQHE